MSVDIFGPSYSYGNSLNLQNKSFLPGAVWLQVTLHWSCSREYLQVQELSQDMGQDH